MTKISRQVATGDRESSPILKTEGPSIKRVTFSILQLEGNVFKYYRLKIYKSVTFSKLMAEHEDNFNP